MINQSNLVARSSCEPDRAQSVKSLSSRSNPIMNSTEKLQWYEQINIPVQTVHHREPIGAPRSTGCNYFAAFLQLARQEGL